MHKYRKTLEPRPTKKEESMITLSETEACPNEEQSKI